MLCIGKCHTRIGVQYVSEMSTALYYIRASCIGANPFYPFNGICYLEENQLFFLDYV